MCEVHLTSVNDRSWLGLSLELGLGTLEAVLTEGPCWQGLCCLRFPRGLTWPMVPLHVW